MLAARSITRTNVTLSARAPTRRASAPMTPRRRGLVGAVAEADAPTSTTSAGDLGALGEARFSKLRAALEAVGADTKGLKAALVERLVATQRAAASDGEATTPTPAEAEAPAPSRKRKGPPVLYSAPARQPAKLTRAAQAEISCALSPDVGGRRGAAGRDHQGVSEALR